MWRFVNGTESWQEDLPRPEEEAQKTRKSAAEPKNACWTGMAHCEAPGRVSCTKVGQGIVGRRTRLKSPECIDDGEGARVSYANRDSGFSWPRRRAVRERTEVEACENQFASK